MKRKLLLIGGGGHCRSVIDSVISRGLYDELGIIDKVDSSCLGIPVIGTDEDIPLLAKNGWDSAFVTVGSVGNTEIRRKLYEMVKRIGLSVPAIIDPTAAISEDVDIQEGVFVGKGAIVNSGVEIGKCAIINSGAIIEHDCMIGEFAHISPGSTLCGQVRVGSDSHIGAGSVVVQQVCIGDQTLIGAGSVVVNDISSKVKAFGNPCRVV